MANFVQWEDLFILIDDGLITIAEYERFEPLVAKQARSYPKGLGSLVIIPKSASPPPARVRHHLQGMLSRASMRALGYLVEGTGFKAAAVRAVLISLGVFQNHAYPTKVVTSLEGALRWLLPAPRGVPDVQAAMKAIP